MRAPTFQAGSSRERNPAAGGDGGRAPKPPPTRERILYASAELFRRQGFAATGLKQVAAQAEAPFGSIYHHFPGGKDQIGAEVLRGGGEFFLALYRSFVAAAPDIVTAVDGFFRGLAETLRETGYADACPIATVAAEVASTNDALRRASAGAFESWLDALAGDLETAGVPEGEAKRLAMAVVAILEGGILLSRVGRSTAPIEAAREVAVALVTEAVSGAR